METVFYLKGMSTDIDELEYLTEKFKAYDMELIPLVFDYTKFFGKNKNEIAQELSKKISSYTTDDKVNVVCHSMGCNFIPSLVATSVKDFNVILISPEYGKVSEEERASIVPSDKEMEHPAKTMKNPFKKYINISVFLNSCKWVKEDIGILKLCDLEMLYSKGDPFVSRMAISSLAQVTDAPVHEIDCNNHNPLLENNDAMDIIKANIKKNNVPRF